jgi:aquaporin Z
MKSKADEYHDPDVVPAPVPVARQLAAEAFGTFIGTFSTSAPSALDATFDLRMGYFALTTSTALGAMVAIYAVGKVSGAHTNPAVTVAFALRGDFGWRRVPGYVLAQFAGSVLAAYAIITILHPAAHALLPKTMLGIAPAVGFEIVLTALLIGVCLAVAKAAAFVGPDAAIAMGGITAVDRLAGYYVSGASMNPARTLGPIVAAGGSGDWWVYVAGPALGALDGAEIAYLVCGRPNQAEVSKSHGG